MKIICVAFYPAFAPSKLKAIWPIDNSYRTGMCRLSLNDLSNTPPLTLLSFYNKFGNTNELPIIWIVKYSRKNSVEFRCTSFNSSKCTYSA